MAYGLEIYSAAGSPRVQEHHLLTRLIYTRFLDAHSDQTGSVTIPGLSAMKPAAYACRLDNSVGVGGVGAVCHEVYITGDTVNWDISHIVSTAIPVTNSQLIVIAYG